MTGLLVDYGGVLTTSVFESFRAFCRAEGVEPDTIPHLLVEDEEALAELHAFEIGRLEEAEFERRFAGRLGVAPERLLERIFAALGPDERMIGAVRAVRAAGVPTALVSNSWGLAIYDRPLLAELFDAELISAEVGLRKPDPPIFLLAAKRLGLEPAECAMVDDLRPNLAAAEALGMAAVLHRSAEATIAALERLLRIPLGFAGE